MSKNEENHYYIMSEKNKMMSDETSKVRAQVIYLSTICLIFIYLRDESLTSILGLRFSENVSIPVVHLLLFMFASIVYTLTLFFFKVCEDIKAFSPEGIDRELIKDQIISTPSLQSYSPVKIDDYEKILSKYKDLLTHEIKSIKLDNADETYEILESNDKSLLDKIQFAVNTQYDTFGNTQGEAERKIGVDDFVKSLKQGVHWKEKINKLEENLESSISSLERDVKILSDKNFDKEEVCLDFKHQINRVDTSIDMLMKEVKKRAVNVRVERFFNFYVPGIYGIMTLLLVIYFS